MKRNNVKLLSKSQKNDAAAWPYPVSSAPKVPERAPGKLFPYELIKLNKAKRAEYAVNGNSIFNAKGISMLGSDVEQGKTNALYRHYDKDRNLLYIGISHVVFSRLKQHMRDSQWRNEIAHIEITYLKNGEDPEQVEIAAIVAEHPKWNITHNSMTNT